MCQRGSSHYMLQIRPSSVRYTYVFCGLSPDHVNQCAAIWTPENARQFWLPRESSLSYASLPPGVPAHPSGIENIFARRMVLASGFRGSSLRLPLSGVVYCEIATRTLDTASPVTRRGTEGGQGSEEVPITCHGHKTLPSPPSRFSIGYLPLSKSE